MIRESNGRFWHDEIEITEQEYSALLTEIKSKALFVEQICAGEKTIDEVPVEWQAEIEQRVEQRKAEGVEPPMSDELLDILTGESE